MADRPIIFSAPMVRALIDGRKTQTRRVLKPQPDLPNFDGAARGSSVEYALASGGSARLPYAPGDRLWVREQWSGPYSWRDMPPRNRAATGTPQATEVWYLADGNPELGDWERPRPSIHMPRWASRLTLIVTDLRVQRVQDMSRGDAMSEGCPFPNMAAGPDPRDWFRDLWGSLHGPDAWDRNDWVCALTFTVHRGNIDQIGGEP